MAVERPFSSEALPIMLPLTSTRTQRPVTAMARRGWSLALVAPLLLGGCASVFRVDNQVQSFARWGATPQSLPSGHQTYRLERLPSQENTALSVQATRERQLEQALATRGWTLASAGQMAPWTVQISTQTVRLPHAPWEDPWESRRGVLSGQIGVIGGGGGSHLRWSPSLWLRLEPPYFQRQVAIVVRRSTGGEVVYETRAAHDGRWQDSPSLWQAMIDAALDGFPQPPSGLRQVDVDVPR